MQKRTVNAGIVVYMSPKKKRKGLGFVYTYQSIPTLLYTVYIKKKTWLNHLVLPPPALRDFPSPCCVFGTERAPSHQQEQAVLWITCTKWCVLCRWGVMH